MGYEKGRIARELEAGNVRLSISSAFFGGPPLIPKYRPWPPRKKIAQPTPKTVIVYEEPEGDPGYEAIGFESDMEVETSGSEGYEEILDPKPTPKPKPKAAESGKKTVSFEKDLDKKQNDKSKKSSDRKSVKSKIKKPSEKTDVRLKSKVKKRKDNPKSPEKSSKSKYHETIDDNSGDESDASYEADSSDSDTPLIKKKTDKKKTKKEAKKPTKLKKVTKSAGKDKKKSKKQASESETELPSDTDVISANETTENESTTDAHATTTDDGEETDVSVSAPVSKKEANKAKTKQPTPTPAPAPPASPTTKDVEENATPADDDWSLSLDTLLCAMREGGETWDDIAKAMDRSKSQVQSRYYALRAKEMAKQSREQGDGVAAATWSPSPLVEPVTGEAFCSGALPVSPLSDGSKNRYNGYTNNSNNYYYPATPYWGYTPHGHNHNHNYGHGYNHEYGHNHEHGYNQHRSASKKSEAEEAVDDLLAKNEEIMRQRAEQFDRLYIDGAGGADGSGSKGKLNLKPDNYFDERDCRVLGMLDSQRNSQRWLQLQADFSNLTGRMVDVEVLKWKMGEMKGEGQEEK